MYLYNLKMKKYTALESFPTCTINRHVNFHLVSPPCVVPVHRYFSKYTVIWRICSLINLNYMAHRFF